jgi:orotidine 5''-phosphate decarboxylase, subfamily 2
MPGSIKDGRYHPHGNVRRFNEAIIDATKDFVCAYKPNAAFYEQFGPGGHELLRQTIEYAQSKSVPVIYDAKRGDIGNSNIGYVKSALGCEGFNPLQCDCGPPISLNADAITINPYLGMEANRPFLQQKNKGIIVLVKTSNNSSDEIQNMPVAYNGYGEKTIPLYQMIAHRLSNYWNYNRNCCAVIGATYPEELSEVRRILGDDMPILIPGIGAQGGDLEKAVLAGMNNKGAGIIINSSRGIIYASSGADFAERADEEAKKLNDQINTIIARR